MCHIIDRVRACISIHALLAESDTVLLIQPTRRPDFYPRSPCGERQRLCTILYSCPDFYPRSPCGERHHDRGASNHREQISIHALLAESDVVHALKFADLVLFLSTLSLRRATRVPETLVPRHYQFLSTLSLRRATSARPETRRLCAISIHALLAESDFPINVMSVSAVQISIHALLAESDIRKGTTSRINGNFYPRSPCGERRQQPHLPRLLPRISIHALLAESDNIIDSNCNFTQISIHALLAESDQLTV